MRYELVTDAQALDLAEYLARRAREETLTLVLERELVAKIRLESLPWPQRVRMRMRARLLAHRLKR